MSRRRLERAFLELTWLLALSLLPVSGLSAQGIRGVVLEADNRTEIPGGEEPIPVPGAEVELLQGGESLGRRTTTDSLGLFVLQVPRPGTYGIRVNHPAYYPYETDGIRLGGSEALVVEIHLGRNVIPLEPLLVTARIPSGLSGFNERSSGGGFGTFLTRDEIQTRGAGRTTDLLRGLPGVTIKFERWGVGSTIEMRNGFGSCLPTIYVDGVKSPVVSGSKVDDFITPDRIEGVEVYSSLSTVPAQYISGMCGVILFWTRRGGLDEEGEPWQWRRVLFGLGVAAGIILLIG